MNFPGTLHSELVLRVLDEYRNVTLAQWFGKGFHMQRIEGSIPTKGTLFFHFTIHVRAASKQQTLYSSLKSDHIMDRRKVVFASGIETNGGFLLSEKILKKIWEQPGWDSNPGP